VGLFHELKSFWVKIEIEKYDDSRGKLFQFQTKSFFSINMQIQKNTQQLNSKFLLLLYKRKR
jgi:hypothetical protein